MKILDRLCLWLGYAAAVAIIILMLVVVADVCGRYFFNNPITGASELASFLMIVVVFMALAWTALEEKHVKVDLLVSRFSPRAQAILDSITLLLALGIYIIITWQSVLESTEIQKVTGMLRIPHAPFYWLMTVAWAIFCLSIVVLVIRNITRAIKR